MSENIIKFTDYTEKENKKDFLLKYGMFIEEILKKVIPFGNKMLFESVKDDVYFDSKKSGLRFIDMSDIFNSVAQSPALLDFLEQIKEQNNDAI